MISKHKIGESPKGHSFRSRVSPKASTVPLEEPVLKRVVLKCQSSTPEQNKALTRKGRSL